MRIEGVWNMRIRGAAWLALMTLGGLLSAGLTLYGMFSFYSVDFRQDRLLTILFCLLPVLSFPAFLLVRPARRSVALQAVIAPAYLVVYSILDWRTCAELEYCGSVFSTFLETLRTPQVLACLGAAIASFAALVVDRRRPSEMGKQ
jgi:hypothetical protein